MTRCSVRRVRRRLRKPKINIQFFSLSDSFQSNEQTKEKCITKYHCKLFVGCWKYRYPARRCRSTAHKCTDKRNCTYCPWEMCIAAGLMNWEYALARARTLKFCCRWMNVTNISVGRSRHFDSSTHHAGVEPLDTILFYPREPTIHMRTFDERTIHDPTCVAIRWCLSPVFEFAFIFQQRRKCRPNAHCAAHGYWVCRTRKSFRANGTI